MNQDVTEERSRALDAFRAVFHNPGLRRLQLAWAGSNLETWGYGIALAVYAYTNGGATAVAVVGLIRWIPAAIASPFMGVLGDRHSRRLVMASSDLCRMVLVGLASICVFLHLAPPIVYALASIGVVISTAFRPAQAAIIPALATSPQELTASNVVSSTIESLGMFAGPAIGGIFLVISGPALVFAIAALTFLWSAVLTLRIHEPSRTDVGPEGGSGEQSEHPSFFKQALAGFGTIWRNPGPRLLVGLFGSQTFVAGALVVLEVVIARELLGLSNAWVGILSAAFGIGGLLGAVVSGALMKRGRLAIDFGTGILLWGLPLLLIAIWPKPAVALATMGLMGIGNTLVDVAGMTLLQRSVPDEVLARVFSVLETVFLATVALGAIVTPPLLHALGSRTTLIVIGSSLSIVIVVFAPKLFTLDASLRAPEGEVALLRGISFFSPLAQPVIEHLAGRMQPFRIPAGTQIFAQGDAGDRFYVVAQGSVEITRDGVPVADIMRGGYFGEIALLREVPRAASATALQDTELLGLDGEDFVSAVTGHASSAEAAEAIVRSYGVGIGIPG